MIYGVFDFNNIMKGINRIPTKKRLKLVDAISKQYYNGHYTIYCFTTNVAFTFSTIDDRHLINKLIKYDDINDAIDNEIQNHLLKIKNNY